MSDESDIETALARAVELGAEHADARVVRTRTGAMAARDARLEAAAEDWGVGLGVRVIVDGCWGFAASDRVTPDEAVRVAERAVAIARRSRPLTTRRVELAPEPVHEGHWESSYELDPFDVPESERIDLIVERSARLLADPRVAHADARANWVREEVRYADTRGTTTHQTRRRIEAEWSATVVDAAAGRFETVATTAPPVARGWEYLLGPCPSDGGARPWDWDGELARLPDLVSEKIDAPGIEPGRYALVIDPTNLWLTIHESIGHATELDRALGYEANYAGTSFATPDLLGTLRYGSDLMNVQGDRLAAHGLATVGWDDEGVAAQRWDLIRDGVLVGYQLDRAMAAEMGLARSNGCAYADSGLHVPIQRMPNVSLLPDPAGPATEDLIASVEDGIYIVGDRSWSIDMQRYNFQFTGQTFHRIRHGRLVGQVRDVVYQSRTPDFWGSLVALGGPQTYLLGGALNCGKGQPGQVASVSHGCPSAVFEGINILNGTREGTS
ncbi:MAG: TldD/PmbA family protein [bacterium]